MRHEVDVLQPVVARDGNLVAARDERDRFDSEVLGREGKRNQKFLRVAGVVFEVNDALLELRVERGEVVEKALLAESTNE